MDAKTFWESFKAEGENVAEKVKQIVHEGNVRRVVVKHEGRTVAEFPLTAGVVGAVLMGTHGLSGFEHLVLGSVTEKVLRRAPCPVFTVPPRAHSTSVLPFKHLLCAVDFSPASDRALAFACSIADETSAGLTLLHVLEWPWSEPPAPAFEELPHEQVVQLANFRCTRETDALERLNALIPHIVRDDCMPVPRCAHGKPYVEILRVAVEAHADLIVVGVHGGRHAFGLSVLGSTTNQVVRRANCPVLTVRV